MCNFLSLPFDTHNDFIINLSNQAGNNLSDFFWLCFVYVICYLPVHVFSFFLMGASEMINSLRKPRLYLICMISLYFMNVHIYIYVKNNKLQKKRGKKDFYIFQNSYKFILHELNVKSIVNSIRIT